MGLARPRGELSPHQRSVTDSAWFFTSDPHRLDYEYYRLHPQLRIATTINSRVGVPDRKGHLWDSEKFVRFIMDSLLPVKTQGQSVRLVIQNCPSMASRVRHIINLLGLKDNPNVHVLSVTSNDAKTDRFVSDTMMSVEAVRVNETYRLTIVDEDIYGDHQKSVANILDRPEDAAPSARLIAADLNVLHIYTDGSYGYGVEHRGGIGWLCKEYALAHGESVASPNAVTSEAMAIRNALDVVHHSGVMGLHRRHITMHVDNMAIICGVRNPSVDQFKHLSETRSVIHAIHHVIRQLRETYDVTVDLVHQPGHSGNWFSDYVDRLAVEARRSGSRAIERDKSLFPDNTRTLRNNATREDGIPAPPWESRVVEDYLNAYIDRSIAS